MEETVVIYYGTWLALIGVFVFGALCGAVGMRVNGDEPTQVVKHLVDGALMGGIVAIVVYPYH
jgi:hypothetical protein